MNKNGTIWKTCQKPETKMVPFLKITKNHDQKWYHLVNVQKIKNKNKRYHYKKVPKITNKNGTIPKKSSKTGHKNGTILKNRQKIRPKMVPF